MKIRLIVAAAATCAAVVLPTLDASISSSQPAKAGNAPKATTVLDGTYVEVHALPRKNGSADTSSESWLRTANGKAYQLHFSTQPKLNVQQTIRVNGTVDGNQVAVTSAVPTTSAFTESGTTRTGTRSVLIMMVNWTKPDATTPAVAQRQIATDTNKWYRAVSYGKLGFSAKATPWMTIPRQDCSLPTAGYWKVLAAAEKAAVAKGYNPKAYNHEMVYFPYDAKCNYGGLGSVNDRASWVNGEMDSRVTNHELGHNIGLNHARTAVCVDSANHQTTESTRCVTNEYGDVFDTMGVPFAGTPFFSAAQMNRLGWLNGHFVTPTKTQVVTLSPLETGTGTLAARIRVGRTEYWLEFRRAVGVDNVLAFTPHALDGVLIHRIAADGGTDLLDGRPSSTKSFTDAALPVGKAWNAPTGLSLRVTSVSSTRAVVTVRLP